ncbi:MAG: aminoglycoside phosphotransferase family protein [Hyphomonadaceae bacterium]
MTTEPDARPEARADALAKLLAETGFAGARRTPLAGDASTRRYERLTAADGRKAILMDAPRSSESPPCPPDADDARRLALGWNAVARLAASRVEAFVAVGAHLARLGFSTPEIYGADIVAGYAVIEDLGEGLYATLLAAGGDEIALYEAAADVLAVLHPAPVPSSLPAPNGVWPLLDYDRLALRVNADLFVEWLPRAAEDVRIDDKARVRWEGVRDAMIERALAYPRAFTIRDYHAENLLWLPQREGVARVGLLDFQDAVRGWRGWDFSMLLHDARRDVSPAAAEAAVRRYVARSGADDAALREEIDVLGAINTMRILGIFSRLVSRDAKPRYRDFMPREWGHLARILRHPALGETADFVRSVAGARLAAAS